jgi:dynein heavy chain 2, cytosolic
VRTLLIAKRPAYDPDLNEVKEKYYRELKHFIGWPL